VSPTSFSYQLWTGGGWSGTASTKILSYDIWWLAYVETSNSGSGEIEESDEFNEYMDMI